MRPSCCLLLILLAFPGAFVAASHAQQKAQADPTQVARLVVSQTNEFRAQGRLGSTAVNARLEEAARAFAQHMAKTGRFSHGADGATPALRARQHGYEYCVIAENIAYQFSSTDFAARELAQGFMDGWKKSPGHRKNMLDPDVTETGVAVARGGKPGEYYAVQMFGRPASQSMKFSVANRSNASVRYRLGSKTYPLAPRETRTHTQCRSEALRFDLPGGKRDVAISPKNGDRLVVERSESGFGVRSE